MSSNIVYIRAYSLYVFQQFLNQWRKYFSFSFTPCLQFMPVSMAKRSKFSCSRINTLKRHWKNLGRYSFSTLIGWTINIYQKVCRNIFHHWRNLLVNQSFRDIFLKNLRESRPMVNSSYSTSSAVSILSYLCRAEPCLSTFHFPYCISCD